MPVAIPERIARSGHVRASRRGRGRRAKTRADHPGGQRLLRDGCPGRRDRARARRPGSPLRCARDRHDHAGHRRPRTGGPRIRRCGRNWASSSCRATCRTSRRSAISAEPCFFPSRSRPRTCSAPSDGPSLVPRHRWNRPPIEPNTRPCRRCRTRPRPRNANQTSARPASRTHRALSFRDSQVQRLRLGRTRSPVVLRWCPPRPARESAPRCPCNP